MNNKKTFFHIDLVLQFLLMVPMFVCYFIMLSEFFFLVWALLFQLGVGIVQLLSGAFYAIIRKSDWHKRYFLAAVGYILLLLVVLTFTSANGNDTIFFTCFGIFSGLVPVCIAIWYSYSSINYHKHYQMPLEQQRGADDLLDDLFQLHN